MGRRSKGRSEEPVGDYRHNEAQRKNNPLVGIAPNYEVRECKVTSYAYDPHLDRQVQWAGKAEHTSFEVDLFSVTFMSASPRRPFSAPSSAHMESWQGVETMALVEETGITN